MKKEKLLNWIIFIVLALVWGSSFILMKKSAAHLNGFQIGAVRIFSAGLMFLPFAVAHLQQVPKNKWLVIILSGLLGNFFPAFLFAVAIEEKMDSSVAAILNSLTPLFVIVVGVLFFKTKIQAKKIAGVLIGFAGLLVLSLSKGPVSFHEFGFTLLILLATIMYGLNVNLVSNYLRGVNPFHIASISLAFIAIPAFAVILQQHLIGDFTEHKEIRSSVVMAVILGVAGTGAATALFYVLIKKAGGLFASLVTYAIPVVALLWGVWAHENIGLVQISCLAIILSGVYLANKG